MIAQRTSSRLLLCVATVYGLVGQPFSSSSASAHFTTVINLPPDSPPASIGSHTQLNVFDEGVLTGNLINPFQAGDANGSSSHVEVNVFGGAVDGPFNANGGSAVNISGGLVGPRFKSDSSSAVNISGGAVNREFIAVAGSAVTIVGGEFRLNGTPIAGLEQPGSHAQLDVPADFLLSGTLADGTPFVFGSEASDSFAAGSLTLEGTALAPLGPIDLNVPGDDPPRGLRQGQKLTLSSGGEIGEMFQAGVGSQLTVTGGAVGRFLKAVGATVNVSGGIVGDNFDAFSGTVINISGGFVDHHFSAKSGSVVNISGGSVGQLFDAERGSVVNISGGTVDGRSNARSGSVVNVSGGHLGSSYNARHGSLVNISGGRVGNSFEAGPGSLVNISGGIVDGGFNAYNRSVVNITGGTGFGTFNAHEGSEVNLFGSDFRIDGIPVEGLLLGVTTKITDRNVILAGVFADGAPFEFELRSGDFPFLDYFSPAATLTVTLVPEPATWIIFLAGLVTATFCRRTPLDPYVACSE